MKYILITFLLVSLFCPQILNAQAYGTGEYGAGNYNIGEPAVSNNSNSSGGLFNQEAPFCSDKKPASSPQLFQIDLTSSSAILNFVSAGAPLTYYYVAFGTTRNIIEYGTQFNSSIYPGVQKVTINALKPDTKYYFQIRAGNGCMPGDWSGVLLTRTGKSSQSLKRIYYSSLRKIPDTIITTKNVSKIGDAPTPIETPIIAPPYQKIVQSSVSEDTPLVVSFGIIKKFIFNLLQIFTFCNLGLRKC